MFDAAKAAVTDGSPKASRQAPAFSASPCHLAEEIGRKYAGIKTDAERKTHGIFLTPEAVARFMAGLLSVENKRVRLLDPAAGLGILICAVVEELVENGVVEEIEVVAHELDSDLCVGLEEVLDALVLWADVAGVRVKYVVKNGDFVLSECISLEMLAGIRDSAKFDLVIGNPPYFKIGKNDPRAAAASSVVYGQPNIYGVFMAVSAALLKSGGQLVFITPRSFASGPYFARFRKWFFERVRPTFVHVFDSRRDAFGRDEVLQENVIFAGVHEDGWKNRSGTTLMSVSSSHGIRDVENARIVRRNLSEMIAGEGLILRIPSSADEETALERVERWNGSLSAYGLKISTGPVVAFRATKWLRQDATSDTVPLLWLNHVFSMETRWPNGVRKPQHIDSKAATEKLLLPNRNYVVMRRFSAKEDARRLTAAPLIAESISAKLVGLENHLNYIYRPGGSLTDDEAWGLAALYSSSLLDAYFRCVNGNTQVSATELRNMRLPPLGQITELGRKLRKTKQAMSAVDRLVEDVIGG
jgi:adenine-specific DNA-methyltransferase